MRDTILSLPQQLTDGIALGTAQRLDKPYRSMVSCGMGGSAIGGFFAGESMFHRVSNGSKVALFHLVEHLRQRGFVLFDIQMLTPITSQMGGITIPRGQY